MARLYQKINNEAVPLGGGGGGSVAIDNVTITENSDDEIQVATTLIDKINQLNNVAADMGKVLTANGDGTAEWDDVLVPIDYETITKNSEGELQVSSVPYDNTESGLTADNVQDAIDELADTHTDVLLNETFSIGTSDSKIVGNITVSKGTYIIGVHATPQFQGTGYDSYFDVSFNEELIVTQLPFLWSDYHYGLAYTFENDATIPVRVRTTRTAGGNFKLKIDATKL